MQIGNIIIEPWNRQNAIPRLIALGLMLFWVLWLAWGVKLFFFDARELRREEQQYLEAQQRQSERLRRASSYDRSRLEQDLNRNTSKNAVDALRK